MLLNLLPTILLLIGSVPGSLLEELAMKSTSLFPIIEVIDLYFEAGMDSDIPIRYPIKESRRVSSSYGYRSDPFTGRRKFHSGIDYACNLATTVHATATGDVVYAGRRGGYGKCIEIRHKYGFSTVYGHLSEYYIKVGMRVHAGQVIGFVGTTGRSTGYHLHYEVRKSNRVVEPLFIKLWIN